MKQMFKETSMKKFLVPTSIALLSLLSVPSIAKTSDLKNQGQLIAPSAEDSKSNLATTEQIEVALQMEALNSKLLMIAGESGHSFAGHRSHRSHSSHRSHRSGR